MTVRQLSVLLRYWRTMRHLKPVQVFGRLAFQFARPRPDTRTPPPQRPARGPWVVPPARAPSIIGPDTVRLLNRESRIVGHAAWSAREHPRLWLYNLHYFDDLSSWPDEARRVWQRDFMTRWIAENPPGEGPGWESYPTSLRIVNWVKWARMGTVLPPDAIASLAVQVRWLTRRMEHHLLANHLFVNAKALVVAGMFFDGAEAASWRDTGLVILARELPEQLHRDGGHFEGSPMYHALMLEDLLDLVNLAQSAPGVIDADTVRSWREAARRMGSWLRALTHPDGEISFFNDAAFGVAHPARALDAYAAALDIAPVTLPLSDSGYVRAEGDGVVLLADLAAVGPDYQPGHAHADTLSFELSIGAQRVVVNRGTSTYDQGAQRDRERSTSEHSTVVVDGTNSSDVWGAFRVARRARATSLEARRDGSTFVLRGAHDGFRFLRGRPTHEREWRLEPRRLTVTDRCHGARSAVARFLLHPDVTPDGADAFVLPDGTTVHWVVRGGGAQVRSAEWSPRFNVTCATRCIEVTFDGPEIRTEFRW